MLVLLYAFVFCWTDVVASVYSGMSGGTAGVVGTWEPCGLEVAWKYMDDALMASLQRTYIDALQIWDVSRLGVSVCNVPMEVTALIQTGQHNVLIAQEARNNASPDATVIVQILQR